MIPALRQARRISRATLGLGVVASLALVAHLAIDAPVSSASQTGQPVPAATSGTETSAPTTSNAAGSSSATKPAPRPTFSKVPTVSTPSASRPTQARTHSS